MTKKRKRILVLFVLLGLVMCFTAFSLILINYFQPLETPKNLKVENEVLYWDAVPRASVYEIDIDGAIFESKENQLSLLPMIDSYKTYSIQVSAEGKNRRYSDWSEPYSYEVVEPEGFYESLGLYKDNDMVTLTSVGNPKGKIIIPSMINGIVVEQIGFEAFKGRSGITSLYVPSTVKSIRAYAFENCYGLQRVYLDSVEKMEGGVFDRCTSLEYAFVGNCKDIPGYCFNSCEKLRQAEGRYAFQSLGRGAFFNCDSLTSFHASAQLHNIKYEVFACCKNLRTLTVDAANPIYRSEGNCIIRKEDNAVVQGCEGSVIPKGVTAIDPFAFYGVELERVVIPDGVVSIGRDAFMNASLEQVVIPEGIKSIEPRTFDNCQRLTDVQLPNGLEAIGEGAFKSCEKLTHITLDEGLKSIGQEAFALTPLTELEIPASVTEIGIGVASSVSGMLTVKEGNANYYSKDNCIFSKADGKLVAGCAASTIPTGTKVIGEEAFYECPITEIALPEGLEVIEMCAFSRSNLQCVEFPSSLRVIESSAFSYCVDLIYFSIPDSVASIGKSAFYFGFQRSSVTLSGKVTFLDMSVFYDATVYYDYEGEDWCGAGPNTGDNAYLVLGIEVISELRYDGIAPYVYSIECPNVSGIQITVPYRKGYEFMGWATEEGSDAVAYPTVLEEERFVTFPLGAPRPEEGTRLYAIWKELDA